MRNMFPCELCAHVFHLDEYALEITGAYKAAKIYICHRCISQIVEVGTRWQTNQQLV